MPVPEVLMPDESAKFKINDWSLISNASVHKFFII